MAARVARLTFKYAINSGAERANNTLYLLSPSGAAIGTLSTDVAANISAFWTLMATLNKTTTSLLAIRNDEINVATGKVIAGEDVSWAAAPGNLSTAQLPLQVSPVLTLRTNFSGPRFRGRLFGLPPTVTALNTDGSLTTSFKTDFLGAWSTLLSAINTNVVDWSCCVYSRTDRSLSPITKVEIGSILDTQRGRRADLVEQRTSSTITQNT